MSSSLIRWRAAELAEVNAPARVGEVVPLARFALEESRIVRPTGPEGFAYAGRCGEWYAVEVFHSPGCRRVLLHTSGRVLALIAEAAID